VGEPYLGLLRLVVDGEDPSDGLAHHFDFRELALRAAGDLGHPQLGELVLELLELLHERALVVRAQLIRLDFGLISK